MFIGHFAVAFILIGIFPSVPSLVILFGVSFPDLLWPALVLLGREHVTINPDNPLQNAIGFTSYPFSHSLVTGTLIAAIPGIAIGYLVSPIAGILFIVASASHWILDVVMHVGDLPVFGIGKDIKSRFRTLELPQSSVFRGTHILYCDHGSRGKTYNDHSPAGSRFCVPHDQCQFLFWFHQDKSVQNTPKLGPCSFYRVLRIYRRGELDLHDSLTVKPAPVSVLKKSISFTVQMRLHRCKKTIKKTSPWVFFLRVSFSQFQNPRSAM